MLFDSYTPSAPFFDEWCDANGHPRDCVKDIFQALNQLSPEQLAERNLALEAQIKAQGISFTVYSDSQNIDRAWPLDLLPRVIAADEWRQTQQGLVQRLTAINAFVDDLYNEQNVLNDGVVPRELITQSPNFREACLGVSPAHGVWAHICGSDLVRDGEGKLRVLEDNLRVPSGVSYCLENRSVMKRVMPELFEGLDILPVQDYVASLYDTLASLAPDESSPTIAVLTPGIYNSAYFEHSYLAQQLGALLVEGADLMVDEKGVFARTVYGPQRIHVIYRRIDDDFLDPEVFRKDSVLGVPGLMRAWREGQVAIANAPGAGVADDKAVYAYVPKLIEYYLGEKATLDNVDTLLCLDPDVCAHVLDNLEKYVMKPVNESGGYGLCIGPHASDEALALCRESIKKNPRNWIAQPMLDISTCPTWVDGKVAPRHVDLRPFVLQGAQTACTTGGLCRVALVEGSLVVNSSQGGGSKDTWIVESRSC